MIEALTYSYAAQILMWGILIGLVMFVLGVAVVLNPRWEDPSQPKKEDRLNRIGCIAFLVGISVVVVAFLLLAVLHTQGHL